MFHTILFCAKPTKLGDAVIAYIDLEMNSLDVLNGRIVEIGALIDGSRSVFSTVVNAGPCGSLDAFAVHGIPQCELLQGPSFEDAFARLDSFLRFASLSVLHLEESDSEDDRAPAVAMKSDLAIAVVAHNGTKFDFPFLLSECIRAGVDVSVMAGWRYIDTMDVLRATDCVGDCKKLQCAFREARGPSGLQAHRALDDCIALETVVRHVSAVLGVSPVVLLRQFAFSLDEAMTVAQISALIAR